VQQLNISYGFSYGAVSTRPIQHIRVGRFANDENETIRKEAKMDCYSRVCVDRLTQETMSILCQDTQCPGEDSNRITSEYKLGASPLQATWTSHPSLISRAEKHLKVIQPSHLVSCVNFVQITTPHISATSRSTTLNFDFCLKPQGNI
jgi:hypothetical protein